jgi:phosphatidylglycerophosphatase A
MSTAADRARWLLVTGCGLGLAPFAPGTVGTLGGVGIAIALQFLLHGATLALALAAAALVLFALGATTTSYVRRAFAREDPGAFVLDEIVGYLVTLSLWAAWHGDPSPAAHAAAFFLFRAFDVLKLPPAAGLERQPGALGILLDDVAAGVQAGLVLLLAGWLGLPWLT